MVREKGSDLDQYPHPFVAVDVALLTVVRGPGPGHQLCVLVHRRGEGAGEGEWVLPGRFLREHESLEETARVALSQKVGVERRSPRQLRVFDKQGRDDRGWVLSVAHVDLVPERELPAPLRSDCILAPLVGEPVRAQLPEGGHLFFDHDEIVETAVDEVRERYASAPDPNRLLGDEFTLYQLQRLHEAVLGPHAPKKDAFRRQMKRHLVKIEKPAPRAVGKPAQLWGHAVAAADPHRSA